MKKRIVSIFVAALLLLIIPMTATAADDASKLIVYYDFDGDFVDELNGSTLSLIDVIESADATYGNAASSFGNDTGDGDTSYWQWTSAGARGGGFCIDVDDLNIIENYSIGVRFVYDDISAGSWDKIIDYKDRESDDGFYFYTGKLQFYPNSAGTGDTVFSAGTILDIIVTRDASTGEFIAYTVENGTRVKQIDYDDITTRYAIPAEIGGKVRFGFFHDDSATSSESTSGGKVYSVKIWNGLITAEQATGAMETPNRLSFNSNGAAEGTPPSDILANEGDEVTIPGNSGSLAKTGMHVSMWNMQEDGLGDDIAFGSAYTMPADDEELFAKWAVNTYSVHFNKNGGTGSMPDQSFTYGVAQDLTENAFVMDGHIFDGWANTAEGVVQYSDKQNVNNLSGDNDAVVQLYAKWTKLTLSSSVKSAKIFTGGRIVLTPNIEGGEWDWDENYLSATFNSPATFTGLKAGNTTVTYTVNGAVIQYDITIEDSNLPSTGQNYTLVLILAGAAVIVFVAGAVTFIRRRKQA